MRFSSLCHDSWVLRGHSQVLFVNLPFSSLSLSSNYEKKNHEYPSSEANFSPIVFFFFFSSICVCQAPSKWQELLQSRLLRLNQPSLYYIELYILHNYNSTHKSIHSSNMSFLINQMKTQLKKLMTHVSKTHSVFSP